MCRLMERLRFSVAKGVGATDPGGRSVQRLEWYTIASSAPTDSRSPIPDDPEREREAFRFLLDFVPMDNDSQLKKDLLSGDPKVTLEVRKWIRAAFFPYRGRLGNDLEDLEQDALIALLEAVRAGKYKEQSRLKTFARAIAHHKCLDSLRAASRREWVDVENMELEDDRRDPMASLTADESRRMALRALQETGAPCRRLWSMLEQGMDQQMMAEHLEITQGTLRVRLHRCREKALQVRRKLLDD